jgi:DNA-directed RNA polymerase subunit H (RpoH/RPB5)
MDDGTDFLRRLGRIHRAFHTSGHHVLDAIVRTSTEMLQDRLCPNVTVSERPLRDLLAGRPVVTSDTTNVFVHTEEKVGVKFARTIVEQSDDKLAVCVSIDGPTAFTRNEFQNRPIQFMSCKSLCVNVTRHELVPKHRLLEGDPPHEKHRLPLIMETDAVVQYYNWPVGSVVEIERVFTGDEPVPYLRLVSASS